MSEKYAHKSGKPNPQGKGLVPVLLDLQNHPAAFRKRKSPAEFLRDYCVSSLVLAADFRFKPVINKPYYLYSTSTGWNLSMVSPAEWRDHPPGGFVASCALREDMTWQVDFDAGAANAAVREKLEAHAEAFIHSFDHEGTVASALPFYVAELPYYRRVMAAALASSLHYSLPDDTNLKKIALSLDGAQDLLTPPQK